MAPSFKLKAFGTGLFLLLAARVAHVHYERYLLVQQLAEKYNSDSSPELSAKDLLKLLKDRGVELTSDQLNAWVGDIDDENNGYDTEEIREVIDHFDDMATWKGNDNIGSATYFGFTVIGDLCMLFAIAVAIWYVVRENQALGKKVTQSSIGSSLRMAAMKSKWKKLETEKQSAEGRRGELESKIEELKSRLASGNVRTKDEEELLAKLEEDLKVAVQKQNEKDSELAKVRSDAQKHMEEAHMSNEKLQAMTSMLRGVEAFTGSGKGEYEKDGAIKGFGSTICKTGYEMKKELFGFPVEGDMKFFQVGKLLAEGADGAYKCHDIATKEEFCVKIYSISNDRQRASMLRDLQAKQRIGTHNNIVSFQHTVETEKKIYVMMELIPGRDILDYVISYGVLPEKKTAKIFYQLCQALKFCHDNDIVHGDVKPENAMVTGSQEEPLVKLIDFGFASFLGTNESEFSITDKLSPPEAFEKEGSRKPTKEGDSFRLGGTLYIMLCGTYPFLTQHACDKRKAGEVMRFPAYNILSAGAKDLIDKLHIDRISMEQAMSHSWLKEHLPEVFKV